MTEHYHSAGGRNRRSSRRSRAAPPDRLSQRLLRQLAAALALFALWMALRQSPCASQWREALSHLLTDTQNLWGACRQLEESLSQGESPAAALEDWCVQVFLPDGLSVSRPDDDSAADQASD